jgi:superfamily II DNA or RNA helicase
MLYVPTSISLEGDVDLRPQKSVRWLGNREVSNPDAVLRSLAERFEFRVEDQDAGRTGMRIPQEGAVHSVLGYWTTAAKEPATVVMPTGTGKTETMVALFAAARLKRLLVIVPSDVLRDQIAQKFETYGVLQESGVIDPRAERPVVGRLRHRLSSEKSAREFASCCNVVIATPGALAACEESVKTAFLREFSHLFVDEAHHIPADSWRAARDLFEGKPVVQFTATPFREDGRHLGGRLLYAFPLREAQRQGYFAPIKYMSVVRFDNPDRAIAEEAVGRLRADLASDLDHVLLARVARIGRAGEVLEMYKTVAPDLNPVILHSRFSKADRVAALEQLDSRQSRIIVCVDMLGEGFDLPALKIAAIHDPHKTLGVTLQFVGRFARAGSDSLGEATVVVGRPDLEYDDTLRRLYSEDADWNLLIRDITEAAVGFEQEVSDFEAGFSTQPEEVPIRSLLPKMSTVVFRTDGTDWRPEGIIDIFPEDQLLTFPIAVNASAGVAWFVTEVRSEIQWGDLKSIEEVTHHLFVLYFDAARQLLYLNSSDTSGTHDRLAAAVLEGGTDRIHGDVVFRAMAGIVRLVPTNVGVLDIRNRARRFSMHVGADVSEGFPRAEAQTKTKTNIFAYGYEQGDRVSIGASLKGRIWSFRVADSLKEWVDWCDHVGHKLVDDSLGVDDIMANFVRPEIVEERPERVVIGLEWPWEVFLSASEEVRLSDSGTETWPLVDAELCPLSTGTDGPIRFNVSTEGGEWSYSLTFENGQMRFEASTTDLQVVRRGASTALSGWLSEHGVTVFLEGDGVIVPPAYLLQVARDLPPFDVAKLAGVDWSGVDLHKESQGPGREADSIQARMVEVLRAERDWTVILDDDGSGEVADLVAMHLDDSEFLVRLVHCKFSSGAPGSRVDDLYQVCGQAQKSVRWKRNIPLMFRQLIRREKNRGLRGVSGLMNGSGDDLLSLEDRSRMVRARLEVAIVQPGLSAGAASQPVLELLAATEVYVAETALATLLVYCSA